MGHGAGYPTHHDRQKFGDGSAIFSKMAAFLDNAETLETFRRCFFLKVDGNEKWGGREVIQVLYGIVAIEGYFKFERVVSL